MMRAILTLILSLCLVSGYNQALNLIDVVIDAKDSDARITADAKGGSILFNKSYQPGCVGSYRLQWTFSKDIRTIHQGDKLIAYLECVECSSPCGFRKTKASLEGANNILTIPGYEMEYNGNLKVINSTAASSGVHVWYEGHKAHSYEVEAVMTKPSNYTAFCITMGGHRVIYVYGTGPAASSALNCHTLLGLGKLVNALEMGAFEGYGWTWMDATIEFALNHIEASNCLSPDYLLGLKTRIAGAANTQLFLDEIRDYSVSLETEVATACAGCSACDPD